MLSLREVFETLDTSVLDNEPTMYFIPGFAGLILLESWLAHRQRMEVHRDKLDSLASIGMGLGSLVVDAFMKVLALGVLTFLYQFRLFDLGEGNWLSLSHWYLWPLLLLADDFSFYWHHRMSHTVRLLWAAHVNHHSSEQYNLAIALRQSWTEDLYKYIFWLWMPLVGFPPLAMLTMISLSLIYQFWLHTRTIRSLGPLEWILNTPSHHRVHHGSNVRYLDRNHGGILIIWDRLFGTFEPETEPVLYGLTTNIHTHNLFKIAFHEFRAIWRDVMKAKTWSARFGYMLNPPGWSPDGSTKTSDQLRHEQGLG